MPLALLGEFGVLLCPGEQAESIPLRLAAVSFRPDNYLGQPPTGACAAPCRAQFSVRLERQGVREGYGDVPRRISFSQAKVFHEEIYQTRNGVTDIPHVSSQYVLAVPLGIHSNISDLDATRTKVVDRKQGQQAPLPTPAGRVVPARLLYWQNVFRNRRRAVGLWGARADTRAVLRRGANIQLPLQGQTVHAAMQEQPVDR